MLILYSILLIICISYILMVGLFTLGIIRHNHQAIGKLQTQIPISVVVAMRNEEENIDNLLLDRKSVV